MQYAAGCLAADLTTLDLTAGSVAKYAGKARVHIGAGGQACGHALRTRGPSRHPAAFVRRPELQGAHQFRPPPPALGAQLPASQPASGGAGGGALRAPIKQRCATQVVAGTTTYVLKIAAAEAECRGFCDADATRGMLEMENDAMRLIAQAGVSVPEPLPAKDGGEIVRLEQLGGACEEAGTCFVRLITFLGGTLLGDVPEYVVPVLPALSLDSAGADRADWIVRPRGPQAPQQPATAFRRMSGAHGSRSAPPSPPPLPWRAHHPSLG